MTKETEILNADNPIISAKCLKDKGFSRYTIEKYLDNQVLQKLSYGKYCLQDNPPDEFSTIQSRSQKIVFSHSTALYLLNLSDRVPITYDITVPQGYNVQRIKRDFPSTNFYYSKPELWELGLETVESPFGFKINVYDKERTILDVIKNKKRVDYQIYTQTIKEYFNTERNFRKILKYSKLMNMEDKVRAYIEMV
ncbi:MAG: hypothetical protein J6T96_10825 [Bacteroidales bacterium]|nr:hypothetical protein [Bacteroidales bacterium]